MLKDIINNKDIVYHVENSVFTSVGYTKHNINKYPINIYAITLKNFCAALSILSIATLSLFAIGLYKTDFTTGPIPGL